MALLLCAVGAAALFTLTGAAGITQSVSSAVTPLNRLIIQNAFTDAWKLENSSSLHYAVASYIVLEQPLPVPEKDICQYLVDSAKESKRLEDAYHIAAVWNYVQSCGKMTSPLKLSFRSLSSRDELTHEESFYLKFITKYTGYEYELPSTIKEKSNILSLSSKESIANIGYALHIASFLPKAKMDTLFRKISGIISHADEVDGKYLQFEGGVTTTALVIRGIYQFVEAYGSPPPFTNKQLIKFANYFLSRLTVNRPKAVYYLLQALSTLVNNKYHAVASVNLADSSTSVDQPTVSVRVLNLLGKPLFTDSTGIKIKASRSGSASSAASVDLSASKDSSVYILNLKEFNQEPGFHTFDVTLIAPAEKLLNRSLVNPVNQVGVKITTSPSIENVKIGVVDPDHSSIEHKLKPVTYPNRFTEKIVADPTQRLIIKFGINDAFSKKPIRAHQTFVKFIHEKSKKEVNLVANVEGGQTGRYRLYLDIASVGKLFENSNGKYRVEILIGDRLFNSPISWKLTDAILKFVPKSMQKIEVEVQSMFEPLPEIEHQFRKPEHRPHPIVSYLFTALTLLPMLGLLIMWKRIGANIRGISLSPSTLGFYIGLGGVLLLYTLFWFQLNMFQTLRYLVLVGAFTFVCGHKMLFNLSAIRRSKKTT